MKINFYIISYDIGDHRRLQKLHHFLKDYGNPVQKSVFECWLTDEEFEQDMSWISGFINRREDRVRVYKLCGHCIKNVEFSGVDDKFTEEPPEDMII